MRTPLMILVMLCGGVASAQPAGLPSTDSVSRPMLAKTASIETPKWFVTKYMGINTSIAFFNGQSASFFSTPVGLQLNRKLSDRWYAFANISVAPTYVGFGQASPVNSKYTSGSSFMRSNQFYLAPAASVGLMYTNEQKSFSISGSFSIEQRNPLMPLANTGWMRPGLSPLQRF